MENDEVLAGLRDSLATPGSPLPQPFTDLRVPEMAEVVNQLPLVEAAEVVRRLPLGTATTLCDYADLATRDDLRAICA
jgi:cell division septal protein FtsQ